MAQDVDIYGQNILERNSIVALPDGYADKLGDTLYSWLGSLWRTIHRGDDMVRGLQQARGMRLAQLYLNLLEAAQLQDRNGAPVFHRELWHPIVLRKSERNKSQENMLLMGSRAQIGPQWHQEPYGIGTVLEMGRMANYADYVTYPITKNIVGMATTIVDNIINPTVVMHYDSGDGKGDFKFRNNSIIFPKKLDPLASDSAFDKVDIPSMYPDPDDPSTMVSDVEVVLWASNVLIDKNYLAEHLSYPLGANASSSAIVKRILNAAWSSVTSSLTPELLKTLLAAMMNIPVIQREKETVVNIETTDEAQVVHTDAGTYYVSRKAHLIEGLHAGSVLHRGDLLDESVRIYSHLNVDKHTPFSVPVELDIPSVTLSSDILRPPTQFGIYAMWDEVEVKRSAVYPSDGNDNHPHLYFDVGGTEQDVEAFWRDVWKHAEQQNVSMERIIGPEGTRISPARFFLKHFIGANTIFVVVDEAQIDDLLLLHDPMFFGMLTTVVPSAVRLFVVEHKAVGSDDEMSLDGAKESSFIAAALPRVVEHGLVNTVPGLSVPGMSLEDRVSMRFVRVAPTKIRVRKEEV